MSLDPCHIMHKINIIRIKKLNLEYQTKTLEKIKINVYQISVWKNILCLKAIIWENNWSI